jgi:hypothetical protein
MFFAEQVVYLVEIGVFEYILLERFSVFGGTGLVGHTIGIDFTLNSP